MAWSETVDTMARYLKDPGTLPEPYELFHEVRAVEPVHRSPAGLWAVTSYDAVSAGLKMPALSRHLGARAEVDALRTPGDTPEVTQALDAYIRMFIHLDDPDHGRVRRLVSRAFTPRAVDGWRPWAEVIAARQLAAIADGQELDWVHDFAYTVPEMLICEMVGVPYEDHALWNDWSNATIDKNNAVSDMDPAVKAARDGLIGFDTYARALIAERRRRPGDDLLSSLIAVEEEGDRLTEDELVAALILLIIAGHETTANLIASGTMQLLRTPPLWERLRADPGLAPAVVEEALRIETPAGGNSRVASEAAMLHGVEIPEGDRVMFVLSAANHDPAYFPDPERFDPARPTVPHLAFGFGMHYCLGAALARMEGEVVLGALPGVLDLELTGEPRWRPNHRRILAELPVRARRVA